MTGQQASYDEWRSVHAAEVLSPYDRALDKLESNNFDLLNKNLLKDVIPFVAVAIKRANSLFPEAHSLISLLLYYNGESQEAIKHADIALRQKPKEFQAQYVRTLVIGDKVLVKKKDASVLDVLGPTWTDTFWRALGSGLASANAAKTQLDFKNELNKLIVIYREKFATAEDGDTYLFYSGLLMDLAEAISDVPMPSGKPNIFDVILSVSVDQLSIDDEDERQRIMYLRDRAEGLSFTFKP